MTSVDISQNLELEGFFLEASKLYNLDIGQKPELSYLSTRGTLNNLDITQSPKLKTLEVYWSKITSLDTSQNPELEEMSLGVGELANVDASQNPKLRKFSLAYNNLGSLNLSSNLNLTDANLAFQVVEGEYRVNDSKYIIDFNDIVGSQNINNVFNVVQNASPIPYDPATGIAIAPVKPDAADPDDATVPGNYVAYYYNTGRSTSGGRNLILDVGLSLRGTFIIKAIAGAGGSITPSGEAVVKEGDTQEYTITPDKGYELDTLSVDGIKVANRNQYTFDNVAANHTIEATFKEIQIPVAEFTIKATAGAGGSITPSGETVVKEGATQEYIITPDNGYELDTLSVDGVKAANRNQYTFDNVAANHTIEATFKEIQIPGAEFTIKATAGVGGSITPSGETCVKEGATQEYIITPDKGYQIHTLMVDGSVVTRNSTYRFEQVREDHTIQVTFRRVTDDGSSGGGDTGSGNTGDSNLPKPPTESEASTDMTVDPTEATMKPIETQAEEVPTRAAPAQTAHAEQAPIEEVSSEAEMTEEIEELIPVKKVDNTLKNPGKQVENPKLGRSSRECNHLPLLILIFVICGVGAILIKRERDITLQMEDK